MPILSEWKLNSVQICNTVNSVYTRCVACMQGLIQDFSPEGGSISRNGKQLIACEVHAILYVRIATCILIYHRNSGGGGDPRVSPLHCKCSPWYVHNVHSTYR